MAAFDVKAALDRYFSAIPDGYYNLAPAAANDQMKATKTFLLDMREASEITTNGWVEGETNIPTRTLIKNLDKLPADKAAPILVMCGSGVRSPMGMVALQLLGYTNVKNVQGGFGAWKTANLPVKTEGQPAAPVAGKAIDADKDLVAALDKFFTGLPDGFNNTAPAAINDQIKATKVALIDVREASEFATGTIEGAVNVPVRTLIKSLDKLPADKTAPVVLICASGHRGMMSIVALNLLGYTNVKNLAGGLNAWKAANLPLVGAPAAAFDAKAALDKYFSAIPDGYYNLAPAAANDQMKATKTFLLDMREASEITTNGWVEGETNIPTRTLIKNLDKLPADKAAPILVMCGSGVRSPMGMVALQLLGYTNVKNVQGGFGAWKTANLPVKTEGQPAAPVAGKAIDADKDLVAALDKFFTGLPDGYNNTQPAAINDQIKATKVALIDVREASEFATGKIEGSVNVPVRTLIKSLDKLPADKTAPVVLICASGHRGMMSIVALNLLGYTNVKNIAGGLNAWKAANLPVVP
jgi:rhodanese-related sulfurtransferase